MLRDYFVADTDEEAMESVINGPMGETWRRHILPTFAQLNLIGLLAGDEVDPAQVTVEWLAENFWLVGSPATVIDKVRDLQQRTGGFGTLLSATFDQGAQPQQYQRHFELLGTEVIPTLRDLNA